MNRRLSGAPAGALRLGLRSEHLDRTSREVHREADVALAENSVAVKLCGERDEFGIVADKRLVVERDPPAHVRARAAQPLRDLPLPPAEVGARGHLR